MAGITATLANSKFFVCTTPQPADLDLAAFEALAWVEVQNVGKVGEMGTKENIISYDTLDTEVTQKSKGIANAGDVEIEVARVFDDPGQVALRAAGATKYNYAFKFEMADGPSALYTNTIIYNRGVVTGPSRPNGGNEDFIKEVFTLGFNQREVVANPELI